MHKNFAIPAGHPRAASLYTREKLVHGFERGLVAPEGLIAHGRGEAYDYLIGEKTTIVAKRAIRAAAAILLVSKRPVISVNGNVAGLCPKEVVELAALSHAAIEVNLFYRTNERELAIQEELRRYGAKQVLGVGRAASATINELSSERRRVDPEGILVADTVLVPLEDGDRTQTLVDMGKTVITIDLNPLSRTAQTAHISIIDNIVRAMPALVHSARELEASGPTRRIADGFDNAKNLRESLRIIRGGL